MYPAPTPSGRRRGKSILVGLLVIAILGAAVGGAVYLMGRSDDGAEITADGAPAGDPGVAASGSASDPRLRFLDAPWEQVTSPSGLFSLAMPSGPTSESSTQTVSGISLPISILSSSGDGSSQSTIGLMFMESDMGALGVSPADLASQADATLRGAAEGGVAQIDGTIESYETTTSNLGPAASFEGSAPVGIFRGFAALHDDVLVVVFLIVPAEYDQLADETILHSAGSLVANG
jgi:hypothetical protein